MDTYPSHRHFHSRPTIYGYPLFFALFFFSVADYQYFCVTLPSRQKHGLYSSLDFLPSLVSGVVKWIDHYSVSSLPTKNLMPVLSRLRHTMLPFSFYIFRPQFGRRKNFFYNFRCFSFCFSRSRSAPSLSWVRSGERVKVHFGCCQIFTFFNTNLQHHHGIYLACIIINHHHLHIENWKFGLVVTTKLNWW